MLMMAVVCRSLYIALYSTIQHYNPVITELPAFNHAVIRRFYIIAFFRINQYEIDYLVLIIDGDWN